MSLVLFIGDSSNGQTLIYAPKLSALPKLSGIVPEKPLSAKTMKSIGRCDVSLDVSAIVTARSTVKDSTVLTAIDQIAQLG